MPGAERRTAVAVLHRMPWAGRPLCGHEGRLDVRCVRWSGGTFQTGPNTQVRTVRKRRTEGSATAFQRSAQVGNGYNVQRNAAAFGGRRRVESVHIQRSLRWMRPKRWQLGPTILFDRPRPAPPHSSSIRFPVGFSPTASHVKVLYLESIRTASVND